MSRQPPNSYRGVVLTTPVSYGYAKQSDKPAHWFIGSVLRQLCSDAGIDKSAIDGAAISSFGLAPDSVSFLTQHYNIGLRWLEQLPFGGASGVIALRRAARAVQCGDAEIVACIGGDSAAAGSFRDLVADFSSFSNSAAYPYGAAGPNAPFALITAAYMQQYGVSREAFGALAVAQRYNAQHYAQALLGDKPLSLEQYLTARPIAEPLHLFDCVMPCAGGEGFLVMSEQRAQQLQLPYVTIAAADERHNAFADDPVQLRSGWSEFAEGLYQRAELTPSDIDLVQTYDDYPVISVLQLEGLGFFAAGALNEFVATTATTFDGGGLPHNTSGGQLSGGQAGSAAGYLGVVETLRQLTDSAGANQVAQPRHGLVSGYGMINYDRGLCSTACILRRGGEHD
ncbi:thiolase family protein [Gammaproteobacteria bacterium LSUCC0057]|uniref:Thiolase family protein n=1 Tax=Gammaproteobacteria bacterium LSUCC0057 TaxID=2559237 RepID=A0A4Y8UIA7_9GAMM|nr:thiolase family protein [Gammaproteobacteria bacterium LSUCC0057]